MANAIGIETALSFDNPRLRIGGHDPILNGGSMSLIDFKPALYPAQNNSFSGIVNGVPTAPSPVGSVGTGTTATFGGGGIICPSANTGSPGVNCGGHTAFDLSDIGANDELLAIMWFKPNISEDVFARTIMYLGGTGSVGGTAQQQFHVTYDSSGNDIRVIVAGVTANLQYELTNSTIYQLGIVVSPNSVTGRTRIRAFIDAEEIGHFDIAYVAMGALSNGGLGFAGAIVPTGYVNSAGLTVYREYLENLTVSTRDPEKQIYDDFAANDGRFS